MGSVDGDAALSQLRCVRCGQPAKLQCPRCLELKLERDLAAFCSQDCFKVRPLLACALLQRITCTQTITRLVPVRLQADWAAHKKLHKPSLDGWHYCTRRGEGRSLNMPEFKWTGTLRPHRIGPMREVRIAQPPTLARRAGKFERPCAAARLTCRQI